MSASTDLLIRVTRRLFLAISTLVVFSLAGMTYIVLNRPENVLPGVVVISGVIGGFIGLQRRLKDLTIEDLQLIADSLIYTWLSPTVGGVLALLVYVLFLSDLLSGQLFPRFEPDAVVQSAGTTFASVFQQHAVSFREYAKLVFWCFLAGYSERFVTDIIGRFDGAAVKEMPDSGSTASRGQAAG
jgi:hypothetical protein